MSMPAIGMGEAAARDYFSLFGLNAEYPIDERDLEEAYRRLQAQVHPDKHSDLGDVERRLAMQWASLANEAYRVLKSPVERAKHLLGLRGAMLEPLPPLAPDFLMAQIDRRERMAAATETRDGAALQCLEQEIAQDSARLKAGLTQRLACPAVASDTLTLIQQLQFCEKLRADIARDLDRILFED